MPPRSTSAISNSCFCICQSDFSFLHFTKVWLVLYTCWSSLACFRTKRSSDAAMTNSLWRPGKKKKKHRKKEWGKHFPDFFSTFNSFWKAKDISWLFPDHVRLSVWVTGKSISLPPPRHFFTISPNRLSRRQKTVVRRWTSPPHPQSTLMSNSTFRILRTQLSQLIVILWCRLQ